MRRVGPWRRTSSDGWPTSRCRPGASRCRGGRGVGATAPAGGHRRGGGAVTGLIGLAAAATIYLQQRQAQVSRLALALREVNVLRGQAQAAPDGDPVKWHAARAGGEAGRGLVGPTDRHGVAAAGTRAG